MFKPQTILKLFLAMAFAATIPACNTMEGAGKDIEKAGDKIEDAADDAKD